MLLQPPTHTLATKISRFALSSAKKRLLLLHRLFMAPVVVDFGQQRQGCIVVDYDYDL